MLTYKGYSIRATEFGYSVYQGGHCVAAGGVFGFGNAGNVSQGKKVVRELIAGTRKPFPPPTAEDIARRERIRARLANTFNS